MARSWKHFFYNLYEQSMITTILVIPFHFGVPLQAMRLILYCMAPEDFTRLKLSDQQR